MPCCVYVCVPRACAWCLWRAEEGIRSFLAPAWMLRSCVRNSTLDLKKMQAHQRCMRLSSSIYIAYIKQTSFTLSLGTHTQVNSLYLCKCSKIRNTSGPKLSDKEHPICAFTKETPEENRDPRLFYISKRSTKIISNVELFLWLIFHLLSKIFQMRKSFE